MKNKNLFGLMAFLFGLGCAPLSQVYNSQTSKEVAEFQNRASAELDSMLAGSKKPDVLELNNIEDNLKTYWEVYGENCKKYNKPALENFERIAFGIQLVYDKMRQPYKTVHYMESEDSNTNKK